jgi:hypothetical protein
VVAVAVALVALEARDQHHRPLGADHAHHVAQHVLLAPLLERLLEALGEAVVHDRREVLLVDAVVTVGVEQLLGADQAQAVEQLRADRVVAGLAAVQRQQRHARAPAAREQRQHPAVLVVRVRGGVHRAGRRLQLEQLLPGPRSPLVGRQLLRGCARGERGREDRELESHDLHCMPFEFR